jgi:1,4-alpha-glucan branching enzyme
LREAVRDGRRAEFASFPGFRDSDPRERIPDPNARETFMAAKLGWDEAVGGKHGQWLPFYRRLLALRRSEIVPRLRGIRGYAGEYEVLAASAVKVRWKLGDGSRLTMAANLSAAVLDGVDAEPGREIFAAGSREDGRLGAWSVIWSLEDD